MMYKAYIFDFDYTLGDSSEGIVESVLHALSQLDEEAKTAEEIRKTIGLSLRETYFTLTSSKNEERAEQFATYFKEKADEVMVASTQIYEPVKQVFTSLRENGCKIGIVTTKFHYRIDAILAKFHMTEMVDIIVGGEDVKAPKPNPEGLLYAIEKLQLEKVDILYIGDSVVDAKTAQAAKVDFAGVLTGTTTEEDFMAYRNVCITENLYGIQKELE
ncbi:MAG: HAD family hydrolase [Lachnospiraceae bacterium]|nr:HAD family hydrolase [Lachnospiraceae bacterium]